MDVLHKDSCTDAADNAAAHVSQGPWRHMANKGHVSHQGKLMVIVWYVEIIECLPAGPESTNKTLHKLLTDGPQQMYHPTL